MTVSAVSHQLKDLSDFLGERLYIKSGRGVLLTAKGKELAHSTAQSFRALDAGLLEAIGSPRSTLRVAVCSCFGPHWLSPRLPQFRSANPEIDLDLRLYANDPDPLDGVADAVISALPLRAGYNSVDLFDEQLVPVICPSASHNIAKNGLQLITTETEPCKIGDDWLSFDRETGAGFAARRIGDWVVCSHYILAIELARAGLGAALIPDFHAERSLRDGTLVKLHPATIPAGRTYSLYYKTTRANETAIAAFVRWFRTEVRKSRIATRIAS
ncbi:LysR family transcriptional regulator [Gemmobacter tilapiae]|uniref:LysR family transcriptional regulator n=1 Tax=Neogemmobacter tilapiae TaxID=875041 RepID=A0A918WKJ9_9RHOB|nr:LysR family transcriptional regulator [Gemmobacter tilapiae]